MKWLLITNNLNPGDIWVRLGIQKIICRLDANPEFIIRERDFREGDPYNGLTEPAEPISFDYSVVCGMPLLWSHREPDGTLSTTTQHAWWHPLTTWCDPSKMIVAGFGIMLFCAEALHEYQIAEPAVIPEIQAFFDRCLLVYSRSQLAKKFFPKVESLHCPSVLALRDVDNARDFKLANLMPGGSHYPEVARAANKNQPPDEMALWLAGKLLASGFRFVAHNLAEQRLALQLGWSKEQIFTWLADGTGDCLLDVYQRCSKYFGQRVHGGIISRAAGADVLVLGCDTRLADILWMGGQAFTPSQASGLSSSIEDWIASPPRKAPYDIELIRRAHLSWWSAKLKLPIRD